MFHRAKNTSPCSCRPCWKGRCLRYRKYPERAGRSGTVRPYALKEFAKRWYLVAYSEEAAMLRVYALDRILSVERTGAKFKMPPGFQRG